MHSTQKMLRTAYRALRNSFTLPIGTPNGGRTTQACPACPCKSLAGERSRRNAQRTKAGSALIELMLAIAILIIVLLGTSTSFVIGRRQIVGQRYYQAAAQLASQKLEETRATGYAGLVQGEQNETKVMYGITYHRDTVTVLTAAPTTEVPKPCKKVTVTIQWTGMSGDTHQAEFVTYVGP